MALGNLSRPMALGNLYAIALGNLTAEVTMFNNHILLLEHQIWERRVRYQALRIQYTLDAQLADIMRFGPVDEEYCYMTDISGDGHGHCVCWWECEPCCWCSDNGGDHGTNG